MNNTIKRLAQILRSYVEEFGPENVLIILPSSWSGRYSNEVGRVKVFYASKNTIEIHVAEAYTSVWLVDEAFQPQDQPTPVQVSDATVSV